MLPRQLLHALAMLPVTLRARSGSVGLRVVSLEMRSEPACLRRGDRTGPNGSGALAAVPFQMQADGVADLAGLEAGACAAFVHGLGLPELKAKRLLKALGGTVRTRAHLHTRSHMTADTRTRMNTYANTHTHIHTHTHTPTDTHTHARTHARPHTDAHARTHTRTQTVVRPARTPASI